MIAGPCGGKTTGQTRLCTFFENMGWKVGRILGILSHELFAKEEREGIDVFV